MGAIEDRAECVRGIGVERVADVLAFEPGRFEQAAEDRQGSREAAVRVGRRESQVGRDPIVAAERPARTCGGQDQEFDRIPRLAERIRDLRGEGGDGFLPDKRNRRLDDGALVLEVVVDRGGADAEPGAQGPHGEVTVVEEGEGFARDLFLGEVRRPAGRHAGHGCPPGCSV